MLSVIFKNSNIGRSLSKIAGYSFYLLNPRTSDKSVIGINIAIRPYNFF